MKNAPARLPLIRNSNSPCNGILLPGSFENMGLLESTLHMECVYCNISENALIELERKLILYILVYMYHSSLRYYSIHTVFRPNGNHLPAAGRLFGEFFGVSFGRVRSKNLLYMVEKKGWGSGAGGWKQPRWGEAHYADCNETGAVT